MAPNVEAERLVYEQSVRSIEQQQRALDELRGRTSILLAAAGIISSLAADTAFANGVGPAGGVAIVGFALAAGLCVWVLLPRHDAWTFDVSAKSLIKHHLNVPGRDTPESLYRFLAERIEGHYDTNKETLDDLYLAFWWAGVLVAIDIGVWLLELALN